MINLICLVSLFAVFSLSSSLVVNAEVSFGEEDKIIPESYTRPTFGLDYEQEKKVVKDGFKLNGISFDITNNFYTPFPEQDLKIGEINSFEATVHSQKGLMVQEFLFGIPKVGQAHLAETGIEVWFNNKGEIVDVKIAQNSNVIEEGTIKVVHKKTQCFTSKLIVLEKEPECDKTSIHVVFLEPLKDKVMAIKAIDFKKRYQITYLNEGIHLSGNSLNPNNTEMIPSPKKYEGLIKVTQFKKYSNLWISEDGRIFERNDFGSFQQINTKFKRYQDSGNVFNREHSEFLKIISYEQNRAKKIFDANIILSEIPDSFSIYNPMGVRIDNEMKLKMDLEESKARHILEELNPQTHW